MGRKIVARKRLRIDGAFDIECQGWNKFVRGVTIAIDGDIQSIQIHKTPDSMVDAMLKHRGSWWGHNSGKYDGLQVLEILRSRGIGQSISMAQSRVTRTMGAGLTIRDSYALVPMGLECLAQMGNVLIPKLWFDCNCQDDCGGYCAISRSMPYYMMKRLEEYCVQDCSALISGLHALQGFADENDYDLCGTIGGSAWATARRVLDLPDAKFSPSEWQRLRSAYYGGRTHVLRPIVHVPGTHWDIGSAYPSALADTELPVGEVTGRGSRGATRALATGLPGIYSCTIRVPDQRIPPLPWGWGQGISFPVGVVSGAWTLNEIQYAEESGCAVDSVHWGMTWNETSRVFADWVGQIYHLRSVLGKSSAWGQWLRLFPNSLCGKMAERPDKRFLRMNPPNSDIVVCPVSRPCTLTSCSGVCGSWEQVDRWGQMWSVPFYKLSDCAHVHWAAYITAASRSVHRDGIESHGSDAIYCDTDSLWTSGQSSPSPAGDGLGQWSLKCRFLDFEAPAPKAYAYTDEETGEYIVRSAGAAMKPREWTSGEHVQDRGVLSILDAARSGHGLFTRAHRRWTLPRHGEWYGDRRLSVDGSTMAVTCSELRDRLNERTRERVRVQGSTCEREKARIPNQAKA